MHTQQEIEAVRKLQDPFFFIPRVLGINYLTPEQNKIIESVWSNKYTAVSSAHGQGKTFIAAIIVLAYLVPFPDTIVLSTAPTGRQVRDLLWAEINRAYQTAKYELGGKCTQLRYDLGPKWFGAGITTDIGREEQSAVKFQGYHASRILLVVDEACGIHSAIWGALDGIASGENSRILGIGNPSMINVPFHRHTKEKRWNTIFVSALTHPNVVNRMEVIPGAVSYSWVKEKINDWCTITLEHDPERNTFEFEGKIYVPNNLFRWKVLGVFPTENEEGLISYAGIQIAMNADKKDLLKFRHMAIDVARFGDDDTVFTFNEGENLTQRIFHGLDVTQVAAEARKQIISFKPSKVGVDCDGIGAGVYDLLKLYREEGQFVSVGIDEKINVIDFQLLEIHSGRKPLEHIHGKKVQIQFANLRAQMFWQLRLDIRNLNIPRDEKLEEELAGIEYSINSRGQIVIMAKEDMKSILGRSPDRQDSLIYCNWLKYVKEKKLVAMQSL